MQKKQNGSDPAATTLILLIGHNGDIVAHGFGGVIVLERANTRPRPRRRHRHSRSVAATSSSSLSGEVAVVADDELRERQIGS
ncbi:Hypothetical predicted protein [Olea europaea subsp. europaea]|uniref:Uncharacterized protein n=1 Tax=Olea europaea subsp. europaea TaxID=158383 RepID=A0A8S0QN14_OLEEU|nr:Hypothetical predicted protein [Olea europaea subsp. europaea]